MTDENSGFFATNTGSGDFTPCPPGAHYSVLFTIALLGAQTSPFGTAKKVLLSFECLDAWRDDGEPHTFNQIFTLSTHKKARLRAALESWRGKTMSEEEAANFDLRKLMGQHAMLQIAHKDGKDGRIYANIAGIFGPGPGPHPAGAKPQIMYDPDRHDVLQYNQLPEWVQKMIDKRVDPDTFHVQQSSAGATGSPKVQQEFKINTAPYVPEPRRAAISSLHDDGVPF